MFDSVELAVGLSIKHHKPLLVVISENKNTDCWALNVTKQVLQTAGNCGTIPLSIKDGTKDYDDFRAIFPVENIPCIYLLKDSNVIVKADKPLSKQELISLLKNALNSSTTGTVKPQHQSSSSVLAHSREAFERKKRDLDERRRILKLVQSDREEQRIRESRGKPVSETKSEPIIRVIPQKASDEVALLIRMFDGSALKHRFKNTDSLIDVRSWIDEHRTDNDDPFTFYQNIPKRWFQATEETQSLTELALYPSASLILKPASNVANAYSNHSSWFSLQSMTNALYVFLGIGYRPPMSPEDDDDNTSVFDGEETSSKSDRDTSSQSVTPEPPGIIRMRTPSFFPNDDGL